MSGITKAALSAIVAVPAIVMSFHFGTMAVKINWSFEKKLYYAFSVYFALVAVMVYK